MAERRVKLKTRSLERGRSAPLIVVSSNEDGGKSSSKVDPTLCGLKMGHEFKKRTFYKPTYCQHCSDLLWGLMNQGYHCTVCNYICHEKCIPTIMTDCIHLKAEKIVVNVPHKWIGPEDKKKKKWCNVCRKKITVPTWYCSVCRCYAHAECRDDSFNDCKRCATYSKISNPNVLHHWIEGNLPSSAKCEVCTRTCSTDLCLFGFKCGWCGIVVHSNCFESFLLIPRNTNCTFRDLKYMMLSPMSVSMLIKDYTVGEEITSLDDVCTSDLYSPTSEDSHSLGDDNSKGRQVLIFDGSGGPMGEKKWRKKTVQSVPVPKKMCAEELLRISLRKIGISTCPDDFALFELLDATTGSERRVEPHENPYYFRQTYNGPLKLYIRRHQQETDCELKQTLKLFNSNLPSDEPFVECEIDNNITFADIIVKSIQLFNLEDKTPSNYCIFENSMEISEKVVELSEKPVKRMEQLTDESLALFSSLRYYLSVKEEVNVELYIWKVPADNLKDKQSVSVYMNTLSQGGNYEIGPMFPSQGGFIVVMKDLAQAQKLYESNDNIYAIPQIHVDTINPDKEPLLVFVNTKSGGKQGVKLITAFNRHLNPHQVFDLLSGGPIPGLYAFRNLKKYRILVAGGDGTVGWVLGALDDMRGYSSSSDGLCSPPCGVIPLGTGNDLARALKWGSGYTGEKVMQLLLSVEDADAVEFDRWEIDFQDPLDGLTEMSQSKRVIMNNYFGIGIDGEIALDFHQAREENPDKFNSRLHNKGVYLQLGVQKTFSRDVSNDFSSQVSIEVDGRNVKLPFGLKGLVILNIPSWGAGAEPWGNHSDQEFDKCSFSDGKVEVMGLNGAMHIGQIKSGIRGGIRIAQGSEIKIVLEETLPIQIDGEAWNQPPMVICISKVQATTAMLVKSSREHFTRGLHDNQARSLVNRQTVIGQDHSALSRRGHTLNQAHTQPSLIGTSTRTLYIKDKRNKESDITEED